MAMKMNLVDAYVEEVLRVEQSEWKSPTTGERPWFVYVRSNIYGRVGDATIMVQSESEARAIGKGYHHLV